MAHDLDEDMTPAERQAVQSAFRLIMDILPRFGNEGDDCVQSLVSAGAMINPESRFAAQCAAFRAFHHGFTAQEQVGTSPTPPEWSTNPGLRLAYQTGANAARLNTLCREGNLIRGFNIGPFDAPDVGMTFERAMTAMTSSGERLAGRR